MESDTMDEKLAVKIQPGIESIISSRTSRLSIRETVELVEYISEELDSYKDALLESDSE